jgi:hypothetical protein
MTSAVKRRPSLNGRRAQIEMIAQAMFWWAWGDGWAKAPRAEKNDYRKSARAFLRMKRR